MIYNFGQVLLVGEGVGVRAHGSTLCNTQQIAAHIGLDREVSGHYCSVDRCPCAHTHTHIIFFFEGPKGRYGPREAWAHMGWVGHPAH